MSCFPLEILLSVYTKLPCVQPGGGCFILNATYTVFSKNPQTVLVLKHLWPKCFGQRRAEPHCHLLADWCPTRRVPGVAPTPCTCLPSSGAPQCRSKEKQMDVCFPLNICPRVGVLLLLFSTCYYFEKEESELTALFCFFFNSKHKYLASLKNQPQNQE